MNARDWKHQQNINEFLAGRFDGKRSVCIGIDLVPCRKIDGDLEWISDTIAEQVARRLRNKINQRYFGNAARRHGKGLILTASLHKEPHYHLHVVLELPENESFLKFKSEVEGICLKDSWTKPFPNISETRSVIAAQIYNNRNGFDSLILF
jgi:hypothetical protein